MIFDLTTLFSNAQAIVADAASTNVLDLGATGRVYGAAADLVKDIGKGQDIPILIQVVEAFNTLTSLHVIIQCDDNVGFASPKDVQEQTIPLARLTAGATISMVCIPPGLNERYMRVYYDVIGTNPTLGKVTAGIVTGVQTNGVTF